MKIRNNNSGFTLLEVIIVIIILAVLASVAMPQFGSLIIQAKNSTSKTATVTACNLSAATSTMNQSFNDAGYTAVGTAGASDGFTRITCIETVDAGAPNITCSSTVIAADSTTAQSTECVWIEE